VRQSHFDMATERFHAIVKASAPALSPRTWYGMPAYGKEGNVICFFQGAAVTAAAVCATPP
jgi:uncharacterized protein YdhG (YjbR/CyaY superfamily)